LLPGEVEVMENKFFGRGCSEIKAFKVGNDNFYWIVIDKKLSFCVGKSIP